MFGWAGEINVFKHALAANGFFANGERVSEARVARGDLDGFFRRMEDMKVNIFTLICGVYFNCDIFFSKWPTTLHCDLGCDNYDSVPWEQGQQHIQGY